MRILFLALVLPGLLSCQKTKEISAVMAASSQEKARVTFVELGSVNCVPCKMMQPVMKAIEQKYGSQVEVIFYDVWTEEHKPYAQTYGIQLIPTQVFLDENGKEFFRHEGFFPEEDIDRLFQERGLRVLSVH